MKSRVIKSFNEYISENQIGFSKDIIEKEKEQIIGSFKEFEKDDERDRIINSDPKEMSKGISIDFDQREIEELKTENIVTSRVVPVNRCPGEIKNWKSLYHEYWLAHHNALNRIEEYIENDRSKRAQKIRNELKTLARTLDMIECNHKEV